MIPVDGETTTTRLGGERENYIPLHTRDLVDYLLQHPSLDEGDGQAFEQISSLILALMHHLYRQRHEELTYIYASLDPDRDRVLRSVPTAERRDELSRRLFEHTRGLLKAANYHKLSPSDIQEAIRVASHWGVRMRVRFRNLTKLEVYGRGYVLKKREVRHWRNFFRLSTIDVPLYQRLVIVFRTSEKLTSDQFDHRRVYLRMFKNIPRQDIDMMLPATGIQMSWLDHSRIVVPSLYAFAMTLWRSLRNVLLIAFFGVFKTLAFFVLVMLAIGFGIKSMFSYRSNTRRRYMLNMAQNLYYQNLDNNAGVIHRLLDEGEHQEACEGILAYFAVAVLLKDRDGVSLEEIDQVCEDILRTTTNLEVDFDVESTCRTLVQLGVLSLEEQGWTALPIQQASVRLVQVWDSWFDAS